MIFGFDEFELDAESLELRRRGKPVRADALVLRLLGVLVQNAGQLVTKQELVSHVWGNRAVSENVITVAMTRLRKALGQQPNQPEFVTTVHGRGYRFVRAVTARGGPHRLGSGSAVPSIRGLPFVGREPVLGRLRAILDEARMRHGSIAVLMGQAGIGKTSALEMIESEATAAGVFVAWSYCRETGDTPPLFPFVQLARELLEKAPVFLGEPRLASSVLELRRILPELGPGIDAEVARERLFGIANGATATHRMFDAIVRLWALVSEQMPCVLVFDDLHRADSASLEVLRYFVGEIARMKVLLLATLRTGVTLEVPSNVHLAYILGHRNCTRLMLEPLDEADVAFYVAAVLDNPDPSLGRSVFVKSEGNPFFMAEFAGMLRNNKGADASALPVPEAALDLLRQRVFALDDTLRSVLSVAAVIGRNFDFSLLLAVSGLEANVLMASLDRALASEVVVFQGDSRTSFAFVHDLLRAAVYEGLASAERRSIHLRVVGALEQRLASGGAVLPADLAFHAHSALPEGDARKAARRCLDAATAAARLRAYGDGVRYLRHTREALDLVFEPSPRFRLGILLEQALYARRCSSSEFESIVREAIRVAREQRAGSSLARAALMLEVHPGFPAFAGAREALEDALGLVSPDDAVRAAILARLSTSGPLAYDAEGSRLQLSQSSALAQESNSLLASYVVLMAALYSRGGPAHVSEAASTLRELEALCEQNPETLIVTPALLDLHRAIRAAQDGASAVVEAALDRCEVRCRQVGNLELLWHVERFRLVSRANCGESEKIAPALRDLHRRAEREAIVGSEAFIAYDCSVVLGSSPDGRDGSRASALQFNRDDPPNLWSLKLRALAALGRHEEARRSLQAVSPALLARLPCDRDYLGTLGALLRAALAVDELEYAEAIEELLLPYPEHFAVHVTFFCEGAVVELLAAIARALGR